MTPLLSIAVSAGRKYRDGWDIAPNSARRVESEVVAEQHGSVWQVVQRITWKDAEGDWDGTFITLAGGVSGEEAGLIAEAFSVRPGTLNANTCALREDAQSPTPTIQAA